MRFLSVGAAEAGVPPPGRHLNAVEGAHGAGSWARCSALSALWLAGVEFRAPAGRRWAGGGSAREPRPCSPPATRPG